jgi:parvulin-like peptidyl-prolyl isomerase
MIAAVASMLAVLLVACGGVPSGDVATVGGVPITKARFDQYLRQMLGAKATLPHPGTQAYGLEVSEVMSPLVQQQVVLNAASKLKVTVSGSQVQEQLAQMAASEGGTQKLFAAAQQAGIGASQLAGYVKQELLTQAVYQKVVGKYAPTDAQLLAYYRSHKTQYRQPESRTVRHVLVKTRAQALRVRAMLLAKPSNANWSKAAKRYSLDKATKDKGGSLGAITPGEMVAPFNKAAFSLPLDVISQPVHSIYGWHILEVTASTPARVTSFAAAETSIKSALVAQRWQYWLTWTQKGVKIVYAAGYNPAQLTASPSPSPSRSVTPRSSPPSPSPSASL